MASDEPEKDYESALAGWFSRPAPVEPEPDDDDPFNAKGSAETAQAVARIREFVSQRFNLTDDVAISVAEVECRLPGCPPLETVVSFWTKSEAGEDKRHHFKLFKRAVDVVYDDLPFAWLMDTLVVPEGFGCECC